MNVLCVLELQSLRDHTLENIASNQEQYLSLMKQQLSTSKDVVEDAKQIFTSTYETSSRSFGVILKDEEIVFYRDENSLKQIKENEGNFIFQQDATLAQSSQVVDIAKGARYITSFSSIELGQEQVTIALLYEEEYALETSDYASYSRHTLLFMILCSILELVFVYSLYRKNIALKNEIHEWEESEQSNRKQIEQLVSNLRIIQNDRLDESIFGLVNKPAFVKVIQQLSSQQQQRCHIIRIKVIQPQEDTMLYLAAILQRLEILKCISTKWEEQEFCILSLNNDTIQLENIVRYILQSYTKEYGGQIDDLHIKTQKVRSV